LFNTFYVFDGFFGISSPENYNSIDFGFEIPDILTNDTDDLKVGAL